MNWQTLLGALGLTWPALPARKKVEIGQRYRQIGGSEAIWRVAGFSADHAGNPHAHLTGDGDPTRIATIALAALSDRRHYKRLSDNRTGDSIHANAEKKNR